MTSLRRGICSGEISVWAFLRCVLSGAAALSTLAACSGSSAPAGPSTPARAPHSSATANPTGSTGPSASTPLSTAPPTVVGPTSVAPPVPGNISQTVAPGTSAPLPKVGLDATAHFRKATLTATVVDPARVHAQARIPGEIAGPALKFELKLTNSGHRKLDLGANIAVTASDAAGVPFPALTTSTSAVSGVLPPGGRTSGRYVFHLPDNMQNPVTIEVTYAATVEVARFVGPLS